MKHADPNVMTLGNQSQSAISDDVLHIPAASKLTPEEIAKAIAHHNKHHKDRSGKVAQNMQAAKKFNK
jgi:hypothetical protein